jgi:NAD(P)-dependent dehydrogenase (short-subunit alcohol dehydrogenase family)
MSRFEGKTAVVTGAGSGIGRATALRLGSEGAAVACLDIAEDAAQKTAAAIAESGGRATALAVDVADPASVRTAVERVVSELGPLHVVCNIAGVGKFAHSHDMPLADWERIIAINLTGTFLVSQAALPHLLETKGNIVNTASNAGLQGVGYAAAYCASKGGVVLLTKAMALEYLGRGVRINAVAPGGTDTPLTRNFEMPGDIDFKLVERGMSPFGMAKPEDLASLFAYVASDEAHMMTGAVVSMDGGLTI